MEPRKLLCEIHWVEWQLHIFEDKYGTPTTYGALSRDFYEAMASGQLSELDTGEGPYFDDFLE